MLKTKIIEYRVEQLMLGHMFNIINGNAPTYLICQCLIQDQIFTSPSPGAVDSRARTHERRVRTSAACA